MRIAVTIISLGLMIIIAFQSCAAAIGGSMGHNQSTSGAAAIGFIVVLLFLIAGAFAIAFPIVSIVCFSVAGIMALTAGLNSEFRDLSIWGFLAFVLAIMSYFGLREKRRRNAEQQQIR